MRRAFILSLALGLALVPARAHAFTIGIGGYGGATAPISQNDVSTGSIYGARLPMTLIPLLSVEPYYAYSNMGNKDQIEGFNNESWGVNAFLGSLKGSTGIKFYPYVGIASSKLTNVPGGDVTKTSYNVGFGVGLTLVTSLTLHARAEANFLTTSDSRQFGNVTLGLSYDLFSKL